MTETKVDTYRFLNLSECPLLTDQEGDSHCFLPAHTISEVLCSYFVHAIPRRRRDIIMTPKITIAEPWAIHPLGVER